VPVNTRFRTDDLAYVLGQSDSAALIMAARSGPVDYLGMVRALLPSLGSGDIVQDAKLSALRRVVLLGEAAPGTVAWPALLDGGAHVSPAALRARVDAVDPTAARSSCTPRVPPASRRARCTATPSSATSRTAPGVWP
jgi:fatty-acyl-CoA synthase